MTVETTAVVKRLLSAVWMLEEAVPVCQELEKHLAPDVHVALGGSVLYKGWSDNDLDIMLYLHDNAARWDNEIIKGKLAKFNFTEINQLGRYGANNQRSIYEAFYHGRKVNLFLLNAP